ncbi:DUF1653 domain-containing protein [Agaribacterium haliotis]|uniref:DUF1653 domain-containing protein n=1 Tax=Agaribacterium haliotis TaxID=2013869 RepID=UPI000BB560E6|nr:DUF1653 domain-containing protein [Agaribacterium haliotis]
MSQARPALGIYEHYKGQRYQLLGFCRHSESEEELALYRCLYGNFDLWVRPLTMFTEYIERDGQCLARFRFVEAAEPSL